MVIPISGFLPVPLPMMIPFMGAQSLVIGKMFGEGFQYGKRKISAMPNEEFNKLTFEKMMSNAREEIKASIPTMNAAMQDMQPMVEVVVREFFNYISLVTKIVTGTGEGPNIFQKEGHELGDWISQQLGIEHTPHSGTGVGIPVTPAGTPVPVPTTTKVISLTFTASNPAKINSTKSYSYSGEVGYHKLIIRQFEVTMNSLGKTHSGTYWPLKATIDIIFRYRTAFKSSQGYWI